MKPSKFAERANKSLAGSILAKESNDKIVELKNKISLLQKEASNKEILLKELRSELEMKSGKARVPIDRISPSDQCRVTFTQETIEKRCKSLLVKGQLEPLILIVPKNEDENYLIEDGEVTWRSACKLLETGREEWNHLEAVFSNLSPDENIHRRTLIHHLHSESLTPLDRAEAIVKELGIEIDAKTEEVAKLLRNTRYKLNKKSNAQLLLNRKDKDELESIGLNTKQLIILEFLDELQVDIQSFVANELDMIFLTEDLKEATRNQGLGCYQAKILNKLQPKNLYCSTVKAKNLRTKAMEQTIAERLNKNKTRDLVSSIIEKNCPSKVNKISQTKIYNRAMEDIQKLSIENLKKKELKEFQTVLQEKLMAIDSFLKN